FKRAKGEKGKKREETSPDPSDRLLDLWDCLSADRGVQQLDWMDDRPCLLLPRGARPDLENAARVRGRHDIRLDGRDVAGLAIAKLLRGIGLDQVVDPCAAAADLLFRKRHELEPWDRSQQIARRLADALRVREMTGVVIG